MDRQQSDKQLIFGRYQVIRRLAVGGMGEIFLARQDESAGIDRLVILKVLLPEFQDSDESVAAFLDEAKVAATLNHPNIVTLYEVGKWEETHVIAMEYIRGESVAGLLTTDHEIPVHVAAHIIRDAALGLDHAHVARNTEGERMDIVHRDISPQNIMVREDGVSKVVDFGIAKAHGRDTKTATGNIKGKLTYMSPEQLTGQHLDARSDQFSLGIMFWEMCANERLFKADSQMEIFQKILHEPIPPLSDICPSIPPAVEQIVARMLDRDANLRFPRCEEVAQKLNDYLNQTGNNPIREVSRYVKRAAGKKLADDTRDLTPDPFRSNTWGTGTQNVKGLQQGRGKLSIYGLIAGLVVVIGFGMGMVLGLVEQPKVMDSILGVPLTASKKVVETKSQDESFVISDPKGAQVYVDGKLWPQKVPTEISGLKPGMHDLKLVLSGRRIRTSKVQMKRKVKPKPKPKPKPKIEEPTPPSLSTVDLITQPPGARVEIDGEFRGETPLNLKGLRPLVDYQVRLELTGYRAKDAVLRGLVAGVNRSRMYVLTKRIKQIPVKNNVDPVALAQTKKQAYGWVSVNTKPWTQISIDGRQRGSTPLGKIRLKTGTHEIIFVNKGVGLSHRETIKVTDGQTLKIKKKF
jgi:serine/threonine protein kinase